jgi:hypothetical protein
MGNQILYGSIQWQCLHSLFCILPNLPTDELWFVDLYFEISKQRQRQEDTYNVGLGHIFCCTTRSGVVPRISGKRVFLKYIKEH